MVSSRFIFPDVLNMVSSISQLTFLNLFRCKESNHQTEQLVASGQSVGLVSHVAWSVMSVGLELSHWVNQAG